MSVAMGGALRAGRYPLAVISHGSGGSPLTHRLLAAHLVRHGFVVAAPEHPGNNRNSNELAGSARILWTRPRHVRRLIDWVSADAALGPTLSSGGVAVIGHSAGGYTALVLAGGRPTAIPSGPDDHSPPPIPVEADHRVTALVLLAPATPWFMGAETLRAVQLPILMFTGDRDSLTPPLHGEIVARGVADAAQVDHRVVANAGHFSFLSPFSAEMTTPGFAPSQDPAGFDRVGFHEQLYAEIIAFLRRRD